MAAHGRFAVLVGAVSALLTLAAMLLVRGIGAGSAPVALTGGVLALAALLGLIALVRVVVVVERRRAGR
jgi:low temperature requirement protein LtrA